MMKLIDQFRSDPNERSTFGSIHANRRAIGFSYRQLMLVAGLSVLTGLGQAAILVIVVRAATAVTAGTQSISGTVGPLSASDLSVTQLIAIGLAVLVVLLLAELGTAWAQANLLTTAQNTAQTRMLANYSGASYAAQTSLSRGDNQQIVFRHTAQAAGVAKAIGSGSRLSSQLRDARRIGVGVESTGWTRRHVWSAIHVVGVAASHIAEQEAGRCPSERQSRIEFSGNRTTRAQPRSQGFWYRATCGRTRRTSDSCRHADHTSGFESSPT